MGSAQLSHSIVAGSQDVNSFGCYYNGPCHHRAQDPDCICKLQTKAFDLAIRPQKCHFGGLVSDRAFGTRLTERHERQKHPP